VIAAQQDRMNAAILQSMAASLRVNMPFSFNPIDMAELLEGLAVRIAPKPIAVGRNE
jgi:hypothetical protein